MRRILAWSTKSGDPQKTKHTSPSSARSSRIAAFCSACTARSAARAASRMACWPGAGVPMPETDWAINFKDPLVDTDSLGSYPPSFGVLRLQLQKGTRLQVSQYGRALFGGPKRELQGNHCHLLKVPKSYSPPPPPTKSRKPKIRTRKLLPKTCLEHASLQRTKGGGFP